MNMEEGKPHKLLKRINCKKSHRTISSGLCAKIKTNTSSTSGYFEQDSVNFHSHPEPHLGHGKTSHSKCSLSST